MTREQFDKTSINKDIGNSSTETLSVNTSRADTVLVLLDDGTTGNSPPSYDISAKIYTKQIDDYQTVSSSSAITEPSKEYNAYGNKMDIDITNQSGSTAQFRVQVFCYRQMD